MNDGARNARLNETRIVWSSAGLIMNVVRGENTASSTDDPPEIFAQEDLVLQVRAPFVAVVVGQRKRDIERVVAEVAAVAEDMRGADRGDIVGLNVERLGVEVERQRLAGRQERQQVRRIAIEQVREERDAPSTLLIPRHEESEPRVARDVERTDAGMNQSLRARDAAFDGHRSPVARDVVVDAPVELRLLGPLVRE